MEEKIISIIDLGTNSLKCSIYQRNENEEYSLVGFSKKKTEGIHNSIIINFQKATDSLRTCVGEAEKKSKINIKKINVIIDLKETITTKLSKFKKIDGSKIEKSDISFLLREAKKEIEKNNNKLSQIHIFNYKYIVDDNIYKDLPIEIYANQLCIENIFVSVPKNYLKNIIKVFNSCDLEIGRFILSPYASGVSCFSENQIEQGCGLIDFGYEKTSLAIFKNNSLFQTFNFPIGSNHITKDIMRGCYLSKKESEQIKKNNKLFEILDEKEFLNENFFIDTKYKKISNKFLKEIILSRLKEILNKIFEEIDKLNFKDSIKRNLFFVGEGSNICELKKFLIEDYKATNPKLSIYDNDSEFIPCNGTLKILAKGFTSEAVAVPKNLDNSKKGFFSKIFNIFD